MSKLSVNDIGSFYEIVEKFEAGKHTLYANNILEVHEKRFGKHGTKIIARKNHAQYNLYTIKSEIFYKHTKKIKPPKKCNDTKKQYIANTDIIASYADEWSTKIKIRKGDICQTITYIGGSKYSDYLVIEHGVQRLFMPAKKFYDNVSVFVEGKNHKKKNIVKTNDDEKDITGVKLPFPYFGIAKTNFWLHNMCSINQNDKIYICIHNHQYYYLLIYTNNNNNIQNPDSIYNLGNYSDYLSITQDIDRYCAPQPLHTLLKACDSYNLNSDIVGINPKYISKQILKQRGKKICYIGGITPDKYLYAGDKIEVISTACDERYVVIKVKDDKKNGKELNAYCRVDQLINSIIFANAGKPNDINSVCLDDNKSDSTDQIQDDVYDTQIAKIESDILTDECQTVEIQNIITDTNINQVKPGQVYKTKTLINSYTTRCTDKTDLVIGVNVVFTIMNITLSFDEKAILASTATRTATNYRGHYYNETLYINVNAIRQNCSLVQDINVL